MTTIIYAATNCVNNDGGICAAEEIKFALVDGSDVDLRCESFEPRPPGKPKKWTGDTDAYDNREGAPTESVASSHKK